MAVNCDISDYIVQTSENVTLIGAGQVNKGILTDSLSIAPYLVAADGGAELALKYGRMPKKVIGDFDSLKPEIAAQIASNALHPIKEQNSTDFDKALRNIAAPLILAVGFMGRRVDHQLAAFSSVFAHADRPCILIGKSDIVFHAPAALRMTLEAGMRFSLFPMQPVTGRSTGLHWPIEGLKFVPGGQIGTSNKVVEAEVTLCMDGPGMLVILPRDATRAAATALRGHSSVPGQ